MPIVLDVSIEWHPREVVLAEHMLCSAAATLQWMSIKVAKARKVKPGALKGCVATVCRSLSCVVRMMICTQHPNCWCGQVSGVKYPIMTGDPALVGEEQAAKFNCTQRGHQNTLETLPLVLALQLLIAQVPCRKGVWNVNLSGRRPTYVR